MLKFKKNDDKSIKDGKITTSSTTTVQKSETFSVQNTRTVTYSQSLSYSGTHTGAASSIQSTLNNASDLFKASNLQSSPNLNSTSIFSTNNKPRALSLFETDARPVPFTGQYTNSPKFVPNYQSPFSRQGTSYRSTILPSTTVAQPTTQTAVQNNVNNPLVPTYNTSGKKRGKVIIINNIKFLNNDERQGADVDEKELSKLFKEMGFEVTIYKNLKTAEMKTKLKKFSSDKDLAKVDMSIVVMMSHGSNVMNDRTVPGNFTQVCGTDIKGLEINEIVSEFSGEKCPGMNGKPKLFFFQCCRGDRNELQIDAVPMKPTIKAHADVLIAYSTIPGFYSLRDPKKGTWYIQSICEVFRRHGKAFDVETLLKIVDDELSKKSPSYKQTSSYESRGFKRCFLNPR